MNYYECIDLGSEYCPCSLAEHGSCVVCSVIGKNQFCECDWSGTCVYMEYQWNGMKAKGGRMTIKAPLISRKEIRKDLFLVKLKVGVKLAQDLCRAGSFVFIRGNSNIHFFDTPIAVINSDVEKEEILVAVAIRGPKTMLINKSREWMFVRGPYWNGLFGYNYINETRNSKCLIVLGGIPQASGVMVANQMANNGNEINILINSADTIFIEKYLDKNIQIYKEPVLSTGWQNIIKNMIYHKKVSFVYSGGHNRQHEILKALVIESGVNVNIAISNNNILQCGEGICGSCSPNNYDKNMRNCKIQNENQYVGFSHEKKLGFKPAISPLVGE